MRRALVEPWRFRTGSVRRAATPLVVFLSLATSGRPVDAHPHSGGIVPKPDGTVIVGDVLGSRLLVIDPAGSWREIRGVGGVRDLDIASDGTVFGTSQSAGLGLWTLDAKEIVVPRIPDFHGLFAVGEDGALAIAPADPVDRRPRLEVLYSNGRRSPLATLEQIDAVLWHEGAILVTDGSALRRIRTDEVKETLAESVGRGLYGLAMGPSGPIVSVYGDRGVVEISEGGTARVLLESEPPWAPTDVAYRDGALWVLELAEHPCCWKGPRVRRLAAGAGPEALLVIDDGDHVHLAPWERPFEWMVGGGAVAVAGMAWGLWALARATRRRGSTGRSS